MVRGVLGFSVFRAQQRATMMRVGALALCAIGAVNGDVIGRYDRPRPQPVQQPVIDAGARRVLPLLL